MTKLTLDDLAWAIARLDGCGEWDAIMENRSNYNYGEDGLSKEEFRSFARAILTTIEQAGFKIVPVEATEEMIIQGIVERHGSDVPEAWRLATKNIWRAMQSASPQIEGE